MKTNINNLDVPQRIAIKTKARNLHYKLLGEGLVDNGPLTNYYVREGLVGLALEDYEVSGNIDDVLKDYDGINKPKLWQTLLKVIAIDYNHGGFIHFNIPGWQPLNTYVEIWVPLNQFPDNLKPHLQKGARFFAHVNLAAVGSDELNISNYSFKG